MKRILAVFLAAAALFLGACAVSGVQGTQALPSEGAKIGVRGQITTRSDNPDGSVTLLVEGEKQEDTEYDKASVTVTAKTSILKNGETASADELKSGVRVEVEMAGPVAESYPVQGAAAVIRIVT